MCYEIREHVTCSYNLEIIRADVTICHIKELEDHLRQTIRVGVKWFYGKYADFVRTFIIRFQSGAEIVYRPKNFS